MYSKTNTEDLYNVYENILFSFFENNESSDSVLKFVLARLVWCVHSVAHT